jgi:hypothetical protein
MGPVKVKSDDPYIHQCLIKANEYRLIFIGSSVPMDLKTLTNE